MCFWRALPESRMMQLVQSPNASSIYLTRVLLAGTNCATDAEACAISERLGPLLDSGSPGGYELSRRCCSLCSLRTPRAFTQLRFSWQAQPVPLMLQLVQSPNASHLYSTRVLLAGTNCTTDAAASAVMARLTMFQVQQSRDS